MSGSEMPGIYGRDVLDVLELIEEKTLDSNAQLTLLTSAISMICIRNQIPLSGLRRGIEESYRQTIKKAPMFARAHKAEAQDA